MGVIFFIYNAAFALILLIMVLVASGYALFSKNPDTRYQPMRDDRGSFIKSQTTLTTELDALGATARGDGKVYGGKQRSALDDDDSSFSEERKIDESNLRQPQNAVYRDAARSPVGNNNPSFYSSTNASSDGRSLPSYQTRSNNNSPVPSRGGYQYNEPYGQGASPYRGGGGQTGGTGNNLWQRGAGY